MSYGYTPCVGRVCLVTFQKHPRVLDDEEQAVRLIAAVAEVEAVGEETISLSLVRLYPHRSDVTGEPGEQAAAEVDGLEMTLRSDGILSISPIDDEDGEWDEDDADDEMENATA